MARILGLSAYYHDSAAALVVDGDIVAAAREERFTRIKHDSAFPMHAVDDCLREAGLTPEQLDHVVFYDKPLLKFDRLLENLLGVEPGRHRDGRALRQLHDEDRARARHGQTWGGQPIQGSSHLDFGQPGSFRFIHPSFSPRSPHA